jgi:hypothetical protein
MHAAIEKRAAKMRAKGLEPGGFYNDLEIKVGTKMLEAPTEFGTFRVYLDLYPTVDEAWFYPDAESVAAFDPVPDSSEPGTSQLDQLWAACESYAGTPYVFGGKDIARDGGLDCSGFVCQVFSDIGINLGDPDYTSAQRIWDNAQDTGDDVRPGDIICFTKTYAPADPVTHIGIIREPRPVGSDVERQR